MPTIGDAAMTKIFLIIFAISPTGELIIANSIDKPSSMACFQDVRTMLRFAELEGTTTRQGWTYLASCELVQEDGGAAER
jgi:hypothetical protein